MVRMVLPGRKIGETLSPQQSVEEAFGLILRHDFDHMLQWVPFAHARKDIEGVHQVRISLRRMRSAFAVFRKAIPKSMTDPWNLEMQWIASEMGLARDLDVFVDEGLGVMAGKIPLIFGEKKLMAIALTNRDQAYDRVREVLDSDRYGVFVQKFDAWVRIKGWFQVDMPAAARVKLTKSIHGYATKVLNRRLAKVLEAGERMGEMNDEALHQLRIECKKFRYALEFFADLFEPTEVTGYIPHLKALQGILGTMHDVAILPTLIQKLLVGESHAEVFQYAGAAIGWRAREYGEAREKLTARWGALVYMQPPWQRG